MKGYKQTTAAKGKLDLKYLVNQQMTSLGKPDSDFLSIYGSWSYDSKVNSRFVGNC